MRKLVDLFRKIIIVLRIKIFRPKISVILLNWNRENLLKKTLDSILKSKYVDEVIVIDNNSTDGSKDIILNYKAKDKRIKEILLNENIGGEAINRGFKVVKNNYVLISENDLEYREGWDEYMIGCFLAYKELGQLSPYSPFPEDNNGEVWEDKPAQHISRSRYDIYKALGNNTTTSMIRKSIIQIGVRFRNSPEAHPYKFPDDLKFSEDIKENGYLVGWSKEYFAKNWGHNLEEWKSNKDYYKKNIKSKNWLNKDSMNERLKKFDVTYDDILGK